MATVIYLLISVMSSVVVFLYGLLLPILCELHLLVDGSLSATAAYVQCA